jgi:hypothetical protein
MLNSSLKAMLLPCLLLACDQLGGSVPLRVTAISSTGVQPEVPFLQQRPSAEYVKGTVVELPRIQINEGAVPTALRRIAVTSATELRLAITKARGGDEIVLAPGLTYTGTLRLQKRLDTGWVTIRSGGTVGEQVRAGTRVSPDASGQLARLVAERPEEAVVTTLPGARGWRLQLLEITAARSATRAFTLVALGTDGGAAHLVLDRVYIHGTPTLDLQRCIALNSASTAVVDSWISDCHGRGYDSQAVMGWNGRGPYKIVNNYLEGAGENIMFGGADPATQGVLPADIEIRRNHVVKPLAWQGIWTVKTLFELKIGLRVLVEGNVFENCWADAQDGFGIVLKSTNQGNTAPWSQTADVTFRYNVVRNVKHGIDMAGHPEQWPVVPMSRLFIFQNSIEELGTGGPRFANGGRVFQLGAVDDVTIENNSGAGSFGFALHGAASKRLVVRDNAVGQSQPAYGGYDFTIASIDGKGAGNSALSAHAPDANVRGNVLWGAVPERFPTGNLFPAPTEVGFRSYPTNLEIVKGSAFYNAGVDFDQLRVMTDGVKCCGK